jgi:predicted NBD/HSP70 family sugar kinase
MITLFDPALVVMGGELAAAGDVLLDPIRQTVAARSMPRDDQLDILVGDLIGVAEVRGAVGIMLEQVPGMLMERGNRSNESPT